MAWADIDLDIGNMAGAVPTSAERFSTCLLYTDVATSVQLLIVKLCKKNQEHKLTIHVSRAIELVWNHIIPTISRRPYTAPQEFLGI